MINRAAKGARKERERINYYAKQGWKLLGRAVRTKFQREDIGGAWDFWMAKFKPDVLDGVEWLFVQVGTWHNRSQKFRECREWVMTFGITKGIHYRVDSYNGNVWFSDDVNKPKQL